MQTNLLGVLLYVVLGLTLVGFTIGIFYSLSNGLG